MQAPCTDDCGQTRQSTDTRGKRVSGQTLTREPPLLSRRCPLGSVLTSSGAVVAGWAGLTVKDPDSGCCRPLTLTVMVPCGPEHQTHVFSASEGVWTLMHCKKTSQCHSGHNMTAVLVNTPDVFHGLGDVLRGAQISIVQSSHTFMAKGLSQKLSCLGMWRREKSEPGRLAGVPCAGRLMAKRGRGIAALPLRELAESDVGASGAAAGC